MSEVIICCDNCNTLRYARRINKNQCTYNKASWKYINGNIKLSYDNCIILYNITRKQALQLAKLVNVEYFIFKDKETVEIINKSECIGKFSFKVKNTEEYIEYKVYYPVIKEEFVKCKKIPLVSSMQINGIKEEKIRVNKVERNEE